MDFMGLIIKRNLFLSPSKEKGKEDATPQVNSIQSEKKNGINLKRTWYQSYISLFVNCFNFLSRMFRCSKFKTGRTLRRK